MISKASTPEQYLKELPEDRKEAMAALRKTILKNLPKGFKEGMGYGMLCYSVPHETYPAGYHCNPKQPLPFVSIASQKNFIAIYHMGVYAMPELLKWFTSEFPKHSKRKPDMGKSCLRFKNPDDIPYQFIGELMKKVTVKDLISCYESVLRSR
jgi:hypothetical protein